jgi:ribosomal protein S18 acetylase RimI-like enzyme
MLIRHATASDLPRLNEIAIESKASWGYAADQISEWLADLEIDPETVDIWPTLVAEKDGQIAGFAQLDPTQQPWDLTRLFVDPSFKRQGIGRQLLRAMQEVAAAANGDHISIDSDPNAESFYIACGAISVGVLAAPIPGEPNRCRPQLRLPTNAA